MLKIASFIAFLAFHQSLEPLDKNPLFFAVNEIVPYYKGDLLDLIKLKPEINKILSGTYRKNSFNDSALFVFNKIKEDIFTLEDLQNKNKPAFNILEKNSILKWNKLFTTSNENNQKKIFEDMSASFTSSVKPHFPKDSLFRIIFTHNFFSLVTSTMNSLSKEEKTKWITQFFQKERSGLDKSAWKSNIFFKYQLACVKIEIDIVNECEIDFFLKDLQELELVISERFPPNSPDNLIVYSSKMRIYTIHSKSKEVIETLKTIPPMWLELGRLGTSRDVLDVFYCAHIAYGNLGNQEIALAYLEAASSASFVDLHDNVKINKIAGRLRAEYLKRMKWTLLRNLEERCRKTGLDPLPKQPGEPNIP